MKSDRKEYLKEWRKSNKERIRITNRRYYKIWSRNNKKSISSKKYWKTYRIKYPEKRREGMKKYRNKRMKKDIDFRIKENLRSQLWHYFKKYSLLGKVTHANKYGIDYQAIIEHLKPFPDDISKYHIDHIIPLSLFNFSINEEIKLAFSPNNHRWISASENISKNDSIIINNEIFLGRELRNLPTEEKIKIINKNT